METEKEMIVHNTCGLPVEFCKCPDATMIHHDCEICGGEGRHGLAYWVCWKCEGEGEYFEIG